MIYLRRRAWLGCTGDELEKSDGYLHVCSRLCICVCRRDVYLCELYNNRGWCRADLQDYLCEGHDEATRDLRQEMSYLDATSIFLRGREETRLEQEECRCGSGRELGLAAGRIHAPRGWQLALSKLQ